MTSKSNMKEEFKNQHIVPQAYLNRFAIKKGGKYIIGTRLSHKNGKGVKLFNSAVKDVAYIKNYYDTDNQEDVKYWEHHFNNNFDSLCGKTLESIIASITLSSQYSRAISAKYKSILSQIIMSQAIRVPAYLEEQTENATLLIDSCIENIIQQNEDLTSNQIDLIKQISFDVGMRKNMVLSGVFKKEFFGEYCKVLESKVWIVFYNNIRNKMPFVTSDNPVLFSTVGGKASKITKLGLANSKTVIFFPLTPSIMIGIYSPDILFGLVKQYDGKRINIDEERFIIDINAKIIAQSNLHSFLPEPLFSAIKDNEK